MKSRKPLIFTIIGIVLLALIILFFTQRTWIERQIVAALGDDANYKVDAPSQALTPSFDGPDKERPQIHIQMREVATGLKQPVDIQFVQGQPSVMLVVQKQGNVIWIDRDTPTQRGTLLKEPKTVTEVEQGMLGLVAHPNFATTGKLYTNTTVKLPDGKEVSQVQEWLTTPGQDLRKATPKPGRTLLNVPQPYQNHNAGQLAFGPDGYLYVGWGDGGLADDPRGHGQNTQTMLGTMLRLDVDSPPQDNKPYAIPRDNPFLNKEGFLPEIWAYGFRNPWRYSFGPQGQLIVADVGQDKWEEIAIVQAGQNHGWKIREGDHCFDPPQNCPTEGLTDPIYTYDHTEGVSITGGYVYTGKALPALDKLYVFGDFVTGRIWAIPTDKTKVESNQIHALGKWPILLSSFGQDEVGELYATDFTEGRILKLVEAKP